MLAVYIMGAIVILGIIFHFSGFIKLLGRCDIKSVQFLDDLQNKISSMSGSQGYKSTDSFSFKIPCGDRAYFVNLDKTRQTATKI